jgi:prepilin-type N-terminal cleavage/methylation domain-containing protein
MRQTPRGFTLVEMLVVMAVSLLLVVTIVPVFAMATHTVTAVQRKLSLYESARNILDLVEAEIRLAAINDRGEHFSIKTWVVQDTDPHTPTLATPDTVRYHYSRRDGDTVNYVKMQAGAYRFAPNLTQPGSMAFPMAYPEISETAPEGWKCSIRSSLMYPYLFNEGGAGVPAEGTLTRAQQLPNASLPEIQLYARGINCMHAGTGDNIDEYDPIPHNLAPGFEIKSSTNSSSGNPALGQEDPKEKTQALMWKEIRRTKERKFGGIHTMDFAVAYWDDVTRKFVDVPDNSAIYFWPFPKVVRVTITVCDPDQRGQITLSRIIQPMVGIGDGHITIARESNGTLDVDPKPFNRPKILDGAKSIEPRLNTYN